MDSMWLEVILNTKAEDLDDLCAKLIANGVPGLAVRKRRSSGPSWRRTASTGTMWTRPCWSR